VADRALELLLGLVVDDEGTRWGDRAVDVQRADAAALLDQSGERRHWIGRSRGYAKTDDLGAVTTAVLLEQLPPGSEAIGTAADRDQARLLVDRIRWIALRTPGSAAHSTSARSPSRPSAGFGSRPSPLTLPRRGDGRRRGRSRTSCACGRRRRARGRSGSPCRPRS
jgi:hypothetical protein